MEYVTTKGCAELLGVTAQTVSRLAKTGVLEWETMDGHRVFSKGTIEKYMRESNLIPAPCDHVRMGDELPAVTAVSFFSGALGLDYGMEKAGIASLLFCENDLKCRMTIQANRPNAALVGDICKLDADRVFEYAKVSRERGIDVMFGGPPCQAFSTAGARRAFDDARGNVFLQFLSLANQIRPKYLVIENVRGLLSTPYPQEDGGVPVRHGALQLILKKLGEMNYRVSFNLYNAANFGAPQIRERIIMVAKREGEPMPWLSPTHSNDEKWGLEAWRTLRDACGNFRGKELHYSGFPEKRLKYFRMLTEGQYWKDLPKELQPKAMGKAYALSGGKTGFYRRLSWDKPSATLVTSPTMPATDLCHPEEDRPLAVEEYAAIQGFPSDWTFCGSVSDRYRQIGNAVPVALGEAIGRAIIDDMAGVLPDSRFEQFPYSRYRYTNQNNWNKG